MFGVWLQWLVLYFTGNTFVLVITHPDSSDRLRGGGGVNLYSKVDMMLVQENK